MYQHPMANGHQNMTMVLGRKWRKRKEVRTTLVICAPS